MTGGAIRTERLLLRPLRPEDAEPIARQIAEWEVIRWLTRPPHPFHLDHARQFIAAAEGTDRHSAITRDGALVGVVTLGEQLGYWLGLDHHGQGLMTEAVTAILARHFTCGGGPVVSGYMLGNAPSERVLRKLGFRDTAVVQEHSHAHGRKVDVQRMVLDPPPGN